MTLTKSGGRAAARPQKTLGQRILRELNRNKYVYIMALPVVAYYLIFCYAPIYGAQIAFKRFDIARGITGSEWVGFKHFVDFITGPYFGRLMRNTLLISLYQLLFPSPPRLSWRFYSTSCVRMALSGRCRRSSTCRTLFR